MYVLRHKRLSSRILTAMCILLTILLIHSSLKYAYTVFDNGQKINSEMYYFIISLFLSLTCFIIKFKKTRLEGYAEFSLSIKCSNKEEVETKNPLIKAVPKYALVFEQNRGFYHPGTVEDTGGGLTTLDVERVRHKIVDLDSNELSQDSLIRIMKEYASKKYKETTPGNIVEFVYYNDAVAYMLESPKSEFSESNPRVRCSINNCKD